MAIPEILEETGYLPEGEHEATMEEVRERYGYNRRRTEILEGLEHVIGQLRRHGVVDIWLNGSFTTSRIRPGDVDVVYKVPVGGDKSDWPDVGPSRRGHLKRYHRVDLWRYPSPQPMKNAGGFGASTKLITIKEFFMSDGDGIQKGLVKLTWGNND